MKTIIALLCAFAVSASAATLTLHNSAPVQVEFDFVAWSGSDWSGTVETVYISLEPSESITLEIPTWYGSAELVEYGTSDVIQFVEGDDSFSFWWTGAGFSLTAPVIEEPETPQLVTLAFSWSVALQSFLAGMAFALPFGIYGATRGLFNEAD